MKKKANYEKFSDAQLELEISKLTAEKKTLDAERGANESEIRQLREKKQNLQREAENSVEKLIMVLLSEITSEKLANLFRFFPNDKDLQAGVGKARGFVSISLWQRIVNFFTGRNPSKQMLEELRILLRNALWRLRSIPTAVIIQRNDFVNLLDKKSAFENFEKSSNMRESNYNEFVERYNILLSRIAACQSILNRRRNVDQRYVYDKKDDYINTGSANHDSDDDYIYNSEGYTATYNDYSNNNEIYSNDHAGSGAPPAMDTTSSVNDFAGGGAGGWWENYS